MRTLLKLFLTVFVPVFMFVAAVMIKEMKCTAELSPTISFETIYFKPSEPTPLLEESVHSLLREKYGDEVHALFFYDETNPVVSVKVIDLFGQGYHVRKEAVRLVKRELKRTGNVKILRNPSS